MSCSSCCHHHPPKSDAAEMNKRITSEKEEEGTFPAVPRHVIYEILARLPLQTLMRFKAVSKEWLYTIRDQFLATEFSIRRSQIHTAPTALIYLSGNMVSKFQCYSLHLDSGLATPFENLNQPAELFDGAKVLGTVMGLTCFEAKGMTYFWNLRTREITALPQTEPDFPVNSRVLSFTSLGYDPVKRKYKILKTWTLANGKSTSRLIKTCHKVLTLGTSEWRKINDGLLADPVGGPVFVNGTIYYLAIDMLGRTTVVAFHVGPEKFEVIDHPEGAAILFDQTNLILYKDYLAVVDFEHLKDEGVMTLYVLEDYHDRQWVVKEVVMPLGWKEGLEELNDHFYVSGISTGEILLTPMYSHRQFYVLLYDVEKMSMKRVEIRGLPNNLLSGLLIVNSFPLEYGESILSLKNVNLL